MICSFLIKIPEWKNPNNEDMITEGKLQPCLQMEDAVTTREVVDAICQVVESGALLGNSDITAILSASRGQRG